MNRFQRRRDRLRLAKTLFPLLLFCLAAVLMQSGLSSISRTAAQEEASQLRGAVLRGAVQCYALEGFYPEDLSYLREHYGIFYDADRYVVSYEAVGSNLMPEVSVIPLRSDGGMP